MFFEKENIDTANMPDEMMITIMGGLAQKESTSISNNVKWSYQKRFEKGEVKAFSAPFGYDLCDGKLMINAAQAEIVRSIFNMFLSGNGYQRISEICSKKYSEYKEKLAIMGFRTFFPTKNISAIRSIKKHLRQIIFRLKN